MTVETEVTRLIVEGNNVTTSFSYTFPIPGSSATDQTNAELILLGTDSSITVLADNLWSMTGVGTDVGGTFTYPLSGSPVTTGAFLTLNRIVPYEQTTSLSAQGAYSPEVVEAALDNLAFQTEQLNTRMLQTVRAPITDAALSDLPAAALRKGSFLFFDNTTGDVSTVSSTSGLPSSILVGTNSTNTFHTQTLLLPGATVTSDGETTTVSASGSVTITDGSSTVSGATHIAFTGATVGGSTPNATVAVTGGSGGGASIPQGRLTLISGSPVMGTDSTASTVVYYDSFMGNQCPVWDGSAMQSLTIGSDEISLTLGASQLSGHLYDIYAVSVAGVLTLGFATTGYSWTSNTDRGTGAGSAELQLKVGVWTNKYSMELVNNSVSLGTIAANKGTYLGTIYTTGDGQTSWICKPGGTDAGGNCKLGLYNAYNRIPIKSASQDNRASWTYASTTWRPADNSLLNRITYIDGLAQSYVAASYEDAFATDDTDFNLPTIGLNLDSTSANPEIASGLYSLTAGKGQIVVGNAIARTTFYPSLGLHYIQAMEAALNAGTSTFYGAPTSAQNLQALIVEMEM